MTHSTTGQIGNATAPAAEMPTSWPAWMSALQGSNQRLKQCIELSDWGGVRGEIEAREFLLRQAFPELLNAHQASPSAGADDLDQLRQDLAHLLDENEEIVSRLNASRQAVHDRLNALNRGRQTLSLYRSPRPVKPRFFDRRG